MSKVILIDRMGTELSVGVDVLKDNYGDVIDVFKSITLRNPHTDNSALTYNFISKKEILDLIKDLINLAQDEGKMVI